MQTVLEQGSIDKPLTFDVGLIQLSFIPVCSLNTCNISVKLCRGFALQCFSYNRFDFTLSCYINYESNGNYLLAFFPPLHCLTRWPNPLSGSACQKSPLLSRFQTLLLYMNNFWQSVLPGRNCRTTYIP